MSKTLAQKKLEGVVILDYRDYVKDTSPKPVIILRVPKPEKFNLGEFRYQRIVYFIEHYLKFSKHPFAGKKFILMKWEKKILKRIFGTLDKKGLRRYKKVYLSMARKNGKTELCAAIALYFLLIEVQWGAEIYSLAGEKEQAGIVFHSAESMVLQSNILSKLLKVLPSSKRIINEKMYSFYRVMSAEAPTKHGYNPTLVLADELHVWPKRDLWDTMETSFGTREEPLMIGITTSGYDKNSLCYELYDYSKRLEKGIVTDKTFLGIIFELEEGDDWKDETNWKKANPGLGKFRSIKEMRDLFRKAKNIPAFENSFKRAYLNMWTSQESKWLPVELWDKCKGELDDSKKVCYAGMDLSTTTALTALALVFPPKTAEDSFFIRHWFWLPIDNIEERSSQDKVDYALWSKLGLLYLTPGNVVDYSFIREKLKELKGTYNIMEVAFDPWNATQLSLQLEEDGFTTVEFRQTYQFMSPPLKELLKLVLSKKVKHEGSPVMRWNMESLRVLIDPNENVRPDKSKSTGRIDGVVSTLMALDRAIRSEKGESVYESRGLEIIGTDVESEVKKKPTKIDEPKEKEMKSMESTESTKSNKELECQRCGRLTTEEFCKSCGARIIIS